MTSAVAPTGASRMIGTDFLIDLAGPTGSGGYGHGVTAYELSSAQRRLLRYISLGDAVFPTRGPLGQFRTDYTISEQRLEEHLLSLEALGLVDLIEREDFQGSFDVAATREGHDWVRGNPE